MTPITAKELCTVYAVGARLNYERDGHLTPVAHVLDANGAGASMVPHPERFSGMAREQLASLVMATADLIDVAFVSTITEAWAKIAPPNTSMEEIDATIERGQLQREAETDPNIRTALMVQVYDVRDLNASHSIMCTVKGDPRRIEWDVSEHEGVMEGGLPDYILRGYHIGRSRQFPVDHNQTIEQRLQFLVNIELIAAGLVTIPQPERNN